MSFNSKIEQHFYELADQKKITTKIPYITVDNFPKLGLFTALRFLEWVSENPNGTISLPTGKTPEYFIKWTQYFLENWDVAKVAKQREEYGLGGLKKPSMGGLSFIQIDEFYPIRSDQHNSFYHYVENYYIKGLGLDRKNSLLINSEEIPLYNNLHYSEVFPDNTIDLSLRYRD